MIHVYGDFNCPFSFLASRRVDALFAAGVEVEWCTVEHASNVPVTGLRLDDVGLAEIASELQVISQLLVPGESFDVRTPAVVPNTAAAIAGFAEAVGCGVGRQVRRLLFEAYWLRGVDIGSVEVLRSLLAAPIRQGHSTAFPLRESGFAVGANRCPITTSACKRLSSWRANWAEVGRETTPTLVVDNVAHVGVDGLRWLAEHQARSAAT